MGKESAIECSIVGRVESGTNSIALSGGEREKGVVVSSKQEWHKTSTLAQVRKLPNWTKFRGRKISKFGPKLKR